MGIEGIARAGAALAAACLAFAAEPLPARVRRYSTDLIRIDTSNPPGRETRAARYIQRELAREGIAAELLGGDLRRLNVVARLKGDGSARPLLLMAHTDVVPAEAPQWSVPPFAGLIRGGFLWGRGAQDDKCLLAAEMGVMVELKRRGVRLARDVILLGEADEEAGSTGIRWLIAHAWSRIDAEFALNEGGSVLDTSGGTRLFQIQTAEKIPTRVTLVAHGSAGHGSLPRPDNAVARLARALTRLAEAEQPVRLNTTTRRYLEILARLPDYRWLAPYLAPLDCEPGARAAAQQIRARDPEIDAILRTTVVPTMLAAGRKINVVPHEATAQVDVRRLPNETREEVLHRFREIVNDPAVEVVPAAGPEMPATEPSSLSTPLYQAMEKVLAASHPRALVVPYMSRGATDGAFLRQKGVAVYGVPLFLRVDQSSRAHGHDERMALASLDHGAQLLWNVVIEVAAKR